MQFFNSSQAPWSNSELAPAGRSRSRAAAMAAPRKPEACGWYSSSFDLSEGLDVSEQDNDTLYQLWELAQR